MSLSSFIRVGLFKSPLRVVAAILLRSRETQSKRACVKTQEIQNLKRINEQQERVIANGKRELEAMRFQVAQLRAENQRQRE